MYRFTSDYTEGCHPQILQRLVETNMDQTNGYGEDPYCDEAKELIKAYFHCPEAHVQLLVGGTQTNETIICAALRPHQAVLAAVTSHVNTHEAGAIEHQGHKVLELPTDDGKLTAEQIKAAWEKYDTDPNRAHWAQPKMVYISQPTETGSMYYRHELEAIYKVCQEAGLYLFVDGARLGYSLGAPDNDITPEVLAKNCDVFYIGGTKCGLMFGEGVVMLNKELFPDFFSIAKQNGAIMAKGRLLGVQFGEAFKNNLYVDICRHAVEQALEIRDAAVAQGLKVYAPSPTNQQFFIFTKEQLAKLSESFVLSPTELLDDGTIVARICTSWATKDEEVAKLIAAIKEL